MRPEKAPEEQQTEHKIQLRLSSLLTFVFLAIVGIALAYICGVMSGRHMQSAPPERENGLPSAFNASSPVNKSKESKGKILSAEELEFAKVLRGGKSKNIQNAPENQQKPSGDTAAGVKAVEQKTEAPGAASVEKTASGEKEVKQDNVYDYVFQIAAFKDETSADNLRQKLEGLGLRTSLRRGNKMYIVHVRMRGNAARVMELNKITNELRLGNPVLLNRKPVSP